MCQFHASNEHRGHALGNDASVDHGEYTRMKKITAIITAITFVIAGLWLYIKKTTFFKMGDKK